MNEVPSIDIMYVLDQIQEQMKVANRMMSGFITAEDGIAYSMCVRSADTLLKLLEHTFSLEPEGDFKNRLNRLSALIRNTPSI